MPSVSVFTPSHRATWLDEAWASLKAQTFTDWEWVVVLNQGARWTPPDDPRARVVIADEIRGVGAAKHRACALAEGEVLVELDHDDLLCTEALEKIAEVFDSTDAGFVYSDTAQIQEDGTADLSTWDINNGWEYRHEIVEAPDKHEVFATTALEPTPHNLSLIWFAPNHVRAFRKSVYEQVGGYDITRDFLDDQDLMCRMFQVTRFHHIPEVLYLQRAHAGMTQKQAEINAAIQTGTVELYDKYAEANCLAWAKHNGFGALDLGGAHNSPEGYISVDTHDADICGDIFDVLEAIPDSTIGILRAADFLEHISDTVRLMNEIHRVLVPSGMLFSFTPSTDGRGAFQDPTHVKFFNENSFFYYTEADFAKYVPEIECRFQQSRLVTYFPSAWHERLQISYVQANLIALKDGPRNGGYIRW